VQRTIKGWRLTFHGEERQTLRKVSDDTIAHALEYPEHRESLGANKWRYHSGPYRLIVNPITREVISLWDTRESANPDMMPPMTQKLEAAFSALPASLSAQPTIIKNRPKTPARKGTYRNPAPVEVRKIEPIRRGAAPDLSDIDAYTAYWASWRKEKGLE
jgi:hypothetical protein